MLGFNSISEAPISSTVVYTYIIRGYGDADVSISQLGEADLLIQGLSNLTISVTSTGFLRVGNRVFKSKKIHAAIENKHYVVGRSGKKKIVVEVEKHIIHSR